MASKKYYYRLSRTGKQWIVVATSLYLLWLGLNKFFYGVMVGSDRNSTAIYPGHSYIWE